MLGFQRVGTPKQWEYVVGQSELGLSIVTIFEFRDGIPETLQALSCVADGCGCPVEPYALEALRLRFRACTSIQHEPEIAVLKHAEDQFAVLEPFRTCSEAQAFNPEAKAPLKVAARDHRNTGCNGHEDYLRLAGAICVEATADGAPEHLNSLFQLTLFQCIGWTFELSTNQSNALAFGNELLNRPDDGFSQLCFVLGGFLFAVLFLQGRLTPRWLAWIGVTTIRFGIY